MSEIKDKLENLDIEKVVIAMKIAFDLFQAGNEILQFISNGQDLSDIEMIEIIEKHDNAKDAARRNLIDSIKAKKQIEQQT